MSRVHYLEGDYEQLVINETIDGLFSSYRIAVSYTHLDVYKRQPKTFPIQKMKRS